MILLRITTAFTPRRTSVARSSLIFLSTTKEIAPHQVTPVVFPFQQIETKWQAYWHQHQTFQTPSRDLSKPKKYVLDMFPYPSGAGLHVGHPEGYTASDVMARYWRMKGYDVLHPIGWDSFGLPAEQYAIQTGAQPADTTATNIANFKRQLQMLGFSYDWDRELATTDVEYVKWTQWIFLQLFKKGLAEQSEVSVNWCPALGTVLANEEVINGLSERGDHPVERLPLRQWVLKITQYADRLEEGLQGLEWPAGTLSAQKQWIGRSEGCRIDFGIEGMDTEKITVFTTRADTLMGVTYVTLAPEHPLVLSVTSDEQKDAVTAYVNEASSRSDLDRTSSKEKSGVFTGGYALHPITGERVPIWVGDYVLGSYGTGAVMAVPAHDQRDFEFAQKYGLDIKWVVEPADQAELDKTVAFIEYGVNVNSGDFDGLTTENAKEAVTKRLEELEKGGTQINYKLRDWVFSRQRYWGEPIPIYFPVDFPEGVDPSQQDPKLDDCQHTIRFDQPIPVDEADLPLKLPVMEDFQPGDNPAGCLARARDWRYFQKDGKWFARETNTMPQWAGSCWYYFRFLDPKNSKEAFSKKVDEEWMPVDLYVGGAEHAVLHLLYARFWHQVLFDLGYTTHPEPFQKLVHQGMILGSDGEKMSKSRGNVVNPDDIVQSQGADALRMYEMFMGPLEAVKPWQTSQVAGVVRFMNKAYNIVVSAAATKYTEMGDETLRLMHKTMKKVTEDIENMSFNTAISALMVYANHLQSLEKIPMEAAKTLTLMVSPFAPHLGEECWSILGHTESLAYEPWVEFDEALCVDTTVTIGVQVNGKSRGEISIAKDADESTAVAAASSVDKVQVQLDGKEIKKVIYVPGRILNLIAK
ncbi:leucyl-tRNA synthetase [Fistulifera solaris]|uniref:leucine--tRNA ligase n=1 Tax=Fistulifera solaris TaxID=1519565 RepID=A0A1Z5J8N8_FISSO|nr:leucyl-tRNA synthetase [Fistulifera solaris]|eukprot:GAX10272.1 leucyl-tRNA synthetase [Fistulifera solaris]